MKTNITSYWADFFGLSVDAFPSVGIHVLPHRELDGYHGAWIFRHAQCWLISVPPDMVDRTQARLHKLPDRDPDLFHESAIQSLFGDIFERKIGPAFQGYFDEESELGEISDKTIVLDRNMHRLALHKLAKSGDPLGWSHSGTEKKQSFLFC